MEAHVLDRPIWSALSTRQRAVATGGEGALLMRSAFGIFAAARDNSPEGLAAVAALIEPGQSAILFEAADQPAPKGFTARYAGGVQMVATHDAGAPRADIDIQPLGDADAPEMLALARLTEPGPFYSRTHELGAFLGIRSAGRLIAMAGERLKPEGFTEISGVCTHPDARGRGYASALIRAVAQKVWSRGETPFLHAYADNHAAIAIYETLGFELRLRLAVTVLSSPAAG